MTYVDIQRIELFNKDLKVLVSEVFTFILCSQHVVASLVQVHNGIEQDLFATANI